MTDHSPAPPKYLTYAGMLPFALLSLAVILASNDPIRIYDSLSATALLVYSVAIFTFLNGIRWGVGIVQSPPDISGVANAVLAFFAGWTLFLAGFSPLYERGAGWPLMCFAFLFILHYAWDLRATNHGQIPGWFLKQRFVATIGATVSLTAAGFALVFGS
ncbi:MAG: DUF3429 domain-containing protein [Pseudomonadota bacterium]